MLTEVSSIALSPTSGAVVPQEDEEACSAETDALELPGARVDLRFLPAPDLLRFPDPVTLLVLVVGQLTSFEVVASQAELEKALILSKNLHHKKKYGPPLKN